MKKTNRQSKQSSEAGASSSAESDTFNKPDYEKRIRELESENKAYQKEIVELKDKVATISSRSTDSVEKLKKGYLQKLIALEDQVTELKKKLGTQSQLSTRRPKGDKQLYFEIQTLKAQKVRLQCKMKIESVQSRLQKASLEKEVLQLKKERRRSEYEMRKLLASNQTLKTVVHRKTEEASMAMKRLRDLLECMKSSSRRRAGGSREKTSKIQVIEHELEETARLHELCSEYEREIEVLNEEIANLKEEVDMLKRDETGEEDFDSSNKDVEINQLKEQMIDLSDMLRQLRLQKAELIQKDRSQDVQRPSSVCVGSESSRKDANTSQSGTPIAFNAEKDKTASKVCCSCSKKSSCKTTKCRCRSAGSSCGTSCGCASTKCGNRPAAEKSNDRPRSETDQVMTNSAEYVDIAASQGALLLRNALVEKPAVVVDNIEPKKKPLSDIGNTLACKTARNPGQRKKGGRKPAFRLVSNSTPPECDTEKADK